MLFSLGKLKLRFYASKTLIIYAVLSIATTAAVAQDNLKDYLRGAQENEAQYQKYLTRPSSMSLAATIGEGSWVTKEDIDDWVASQNCYPETDYQRKHAMFKSVEVGVMEEILRVYVDSYVVSLNTLLAAEKNLDQGTAAPNILACIKNHFGKDIYRYWRIFLRSRILGEPAHKFFTYDSNVQRRTYSLKDRIDTMIDKNMPLKKITEHLSIDTSTHAFTYAESTLFLEDPHPPKKSDSGKPNEESSWSPSQASFIKENLQNIKIGEFKKPKTETDSIEYLQLLKVKGTRYVYASLTVHRVTQQEFMQTKPKIPIHIMNAEPELDAYMHQHESPPMKLTCHKN